MNQSITAKLIEQERKLNYLLSDKNNSQISQQFTEDEVIRLRSVLALFSDLSAEGVTKEELFQQLRYLSDINTFKELEAEINTKHTSTQNGVHANIYNFNFNNYNMLNNLINNAESDSLPSNIESIFKEGYLVFQCTPNLMISNQTNIALNVNSISNNATITLENQTVDIMLSHTNQQTVTVAGQYDKLIGSQIRNVPNKQFYIIQFEYEGDNVNLSVPYLTIDILNKEAKVILSNSITVTKEWFLMFINDLPPRITLVLLGAESLSNNEHETFENLFIINRLKTFEDDLYSAFFTEFSNNNVNSLYGQSAAVGISQLYNTLGSTVRQLTGEYTIESKTDTYVGVDIPDYFNTFAVTNKNKFDVFGNSYPIVFSQIVAPGKPLSGYLIYETGLRLKESDYPNYNLLNEIGGQVVTNSTIRQTRFLLNKSKVKQVLSDGTTEELDCWIESITKDQRIQSIPIQGTWVNVNGTILDAQIDGDFNNYARYDNYTMVVDLEGFQICVHDPDNLIKAGSKYKVLHGYKHSNKVTSQVRFVIHVPNVSQEGSVDQSINIQAIINGEINSLTVPIEKQKITYGNGEIIAYVAVLDTITENVTYYTGAAFEVTFDGVPPYPFYTTRSKTNVPNNYYSNTSITSPLITYTGSDILKQTVYAKNGIYIAVTPVDTGGTPLPTYDLKRGVMNAPADPTQPLVGSTVPYLKPLIDNDESTYTINTDELKMAYASLVDKPRASNFSVIGTNKLTIEARISMELDESGGYKPIHYYTGNISTINKFPKYLNLKINALDLNTTNETWIDGDKIDLPDYAIQTLSISINDIFLPNSVLDQINLSESMVQLQSAVQFLKYYATYLETLIDNLDKRLVYVEESLQEIVDYLSELNRRSQSSLGFAGNLVSFLGTGIGMFFPLIGLGVSLVGGLLTSVDKIEQGDVVMGTVDLVVGGLMGVLGIYKYNQRIKNKYGEYDIPKNASINANNITIKPGYIVINNDPPPMYYSGRRRNGLIRNTNMNVERRGDTTIATLTTRLNRQTTLWDDIVWTDNPIYQSPRSITLQGVYTETIAESKARSVLKEKYYKYVMCRVNPDGTIEEKILTDDEFRRYLDVSSTPVDYVKLELLYSQIQIPYNTNIGMDDECNVCLMAANGYQPKNITKMVKSINLVDRKSKWRIIHTKGKQKKEQGRKSLLIKSYGPKTGIETIYNALNPYKQLESAQIDIYQNCISEIELTNTLV